MSGDAVGAWEQFAATLREKPILIGLALVFATILVYAPVSNHGFLQWDDNLYVTANPHVATGLSATNLKWAFTETGTFYWHPVTWLSHMLDCQLFGPAAGSHHAINLLLHAVNVLLLFLLLYGGTRALWRSTVVAALFAFHPLNVETVAWLSERKSLLSALFSLLTIAAYAAYVRRPGAKRYAVVMGTFLLALMSKPMAVTLPVLLLLIDYWPLRRREVTTDAPSWTKLVLEKVPLLLLSAGSSVLTILGQRSAGAMSSTSSVPLGMRLEQALLSYAVYLRKLFWPVDLATFYPYHPGWIPLGQMVAVVLLLVGITAAVMCARGRRYLLAGWFFFVVALVPVSGIVQVGRVVIADRFAYVPAIGFFVAVVWGCAELVERYAVPRVIPALAGCALVVAMGAASIHYIQYWHDGVTLFMHAAAVEKSPDSMIEEVIADSFVAANRVGDAVEHYQRACDIDPQFDLCHLNLAEIKFSRYDVRGALEDYLTAGRYTTSRSVAVRALVGSGEALLDLGDLDGAERQLANALRIDPTNLSARQFLAQIYARKGQ